ncbi:MAG: hypothetical protein NZZ41_02745 [Candidatus Dojkabacteria bacterium]|nr:hypothetical protein [Candidatus Dojkabacteria bacterium]
MIKYTQSIIINFIFYINPMNNLKQIFPSTVREAVADIASLPLTDPINTMRLVTNPAQFGIYAWDGTNWNYVERPAQDQAKQIYVAKVATT